MLACFSLTGPYSLWEFLKSFSFFNLSNFLLHAYTHTKRHVPPSCHKGETLVGATHPLNPPHWFRASLYCSTSPTPSTRGRSFEPSPFCVHSWAKAEWLKEKKWVSEADLERQGKGAETSGLYLWLHAVRTAHQLFLVSVHAKRRVRKRRAKSQSGTWKT